MEHRDREKRKRFDPKNRRYYETRTKLWKHQLNVLKYSKRAEQPEWVGQSAPDVMQIQSSNGEETRFLDQGRDSSCGDVERLDHRAKRSEISNRGHRASSRRGGVAQSAPDVMQIQSSNGEETEFHDQGRHNSSGDVERVEHRVKRSEKRKGEHRASPRRGGVVQSAPDVMQIQSSNGEETRCHDQGRANSSGDDVENVDNRAKRAGKSKGEHRALSRRDERDVKKENWLVSQARTTADDPVGKRIGKLDDTKQEVDGSKKTLMPPRSDGRNGTRVRSSRRNSPELKLGKEGQKRPHRRRNSFSEGPRMGKLDMDTAKQAVDDSKQGFRPPRSDGSQGTGRIDSRPENSSELKRREQRLLRPYRRRNSFAEGSQIRELNDAKQEVDDSKQSFRPPRSDGSQGTGMRDSRPENSSELKRRQEGRSSPYRRRNSFAEGSRVGEQLHDATQAVADSKQSFRPPRSDGRQGTGVRDSRKGNSSELKLQEGGQSRPHRRRNSFSEGSRLGELLDDAKQEVDDSKQGFRPPRSDGRQGTNMRSSQPGSSSDLKLREEGQKRPHRRRNSFSEGSRDGAGLLKSNSNWEIQRQSSGVWRPEDSRSSKGGDGFGVCQSLMENLSLAAKLRDAPVDKLEDVKTESIERKLLNEFRGSNSTRNLTHGKRKDQGKPTLIELQSSSLHSRKKTSRLSESIASSKLYLATSKDLGNLSSSLHSRKEPSRLSESLAATKLYLATSKLVSARSDVTTRTEDSTTASSCTDDLESVAPEYRARAASKLHTLTNKDIDYANRFSVVPGSPLRVKSTLGSSGRIGKSPRVTARATAR